MSKYTWRELERADLDTAAAHAIDMEYRAEQIAREVQKRLAKMEHIVDGLGEVKGEIVRCRDCVRLSVDVYGETWCHEAMRDVEPDGFCAWGEKVAE